MLIVIDIKIKQSVCKKKVATTACLCQVKSVPVFQFNSVPPYREKNG